MKQSEQNILDDIKKMNDSTPISKVKYIYYNSLYDWVLQDYKPQDRELIIKGLVKKGYLRKSKSGKSFIICY